MNKNENLVGLAFRTITNCMKNFFLWLVSLHSSGLAVPPAARLVNYESVTTFFALNLIAGSWSHDITMRL